MGRVHAGQKHAEDLQEAKIRIRKQWTCPGTETKVLSDCSNAFREGWHCVGIYHQKHQIGMEGRWRRAFGLCNLGDRAKKPIRGSEGVVVRPVQRGTKYQRNISGEKFISGLWKQKSISYSFYIKVWHDSKKQNKK